MSRQRDFLRLLVCAILLVPCSAPGVSPLPAPAPSKPEFRDKPFGPLPPPIPPQAKKPEEAPGKPIPLPWIVAGVALAVAVAGIVLYRSVGAWQSSNLFDRQYRFPMPEVFTPRLGGKRCGGHMATIRFGSVSAPRGGDSEAEDAKKGRFER